MNTFDASTPEPEGLLLRRQPMRVRWGDMDALGHVNNTVYFRYFEQIRIEWIEEFGFGAAGQPHGPVIVDAHAQRLCQPHCAWQ